MAEIRSRLGCDAGGLGGLDAVIDRLRALGASVAWREEFPSDVAARYTDVVVRDPEGNELCLGDGADRAADRRCRSADDGWLRSSA